LKTVIAERLSGVRIPLSPPFFIYLQQYWSPPAI
jgi:hypothetical protein